MRVKKLDVVYEDQAILVCRKPAGVATQSARVGQQDMVSLIKNHRAKKGETPYVGLIHRLDQPVEGVMVFAKDAKAAASLSAQVAKRDMDKYYLAVVTGKLAEQEGSLEHYLAKDDKLNLSRVSSKEDTNAKLAKLSYRVLAYQEAGDVTCILVKLDTGRHHQIRLQFSAIGHPLVGDLKYGTTNEEAGKKAGRSKDAVALCSHAIGFTHPVTKKPMSYQIQPQNPVFADFLDYTAATLDN